jgi:hypothetical protein
VRVQDQLRSRGASEQCEDLLHAAAHFTS